MADFKSYNVVYNITANAAEAAATLRELAASAERLGNGRHMEKFNANVRQLAQYSKSITEAMNSFSPRVDMRTFKTQLRLMEHAVSISAQNMRAMIQTALNGTPGQFEKALQGKGSWAAVASKAMVAQEKQLKKDLTKAKANLDNLTKTLTSGTVSERGNDGKLLTRVLPKEELAAYRNRAKIAKAEVAGLENSLAALQNNLTVLGRNTSPTAITTSLNAVGNAAENASKLNEMANAVKKWNKAIAGMPKSQTYKITLQAKDNTKGVIDRIQSRIAQLKASAASIFFGGEPSKPTKKKTGGRVVGQGIPKPADVMSKADLANAENMMNTVKRLAYSKVNGGWSREQIAQAKTLLPVAAKSVGLPANANINDISKALVTNYNKELQKYNDWRAKAIAAAKQNKAASTAPSGKAAPAPIPQIPIPAIPQQPPITVGTKLDRAGMLERAKSGHETLQKLAGQRPITVRSRFNGGGAGFDMSRSINTLQELANTRPVSLASRLNRTGILERAWSGHKTLQTLADQRPIQVKSQFNSAGLRFGLGRALVELQNIANARPIRIGATVSTTGTIPTGGVSSRAATPRASSAPKPDVYPSGSSTAVMPPQLPVINSRTTTGTRNNPVHTRNVYDGSVFNATKRWLYPLTGNTSFGARTPAIVDMAKGMGVMMAVGGAMGAVGSSFSQSVDYQNMMTTTRAILGRSYEGNNFEKDIADMEKIVRREGVLTKFTAPEVAGAAKYLAMAGMDVNTIKAAIKPVTNIALAGDIDLPTAADKMTNIMTAFQMKTPSDFTRASDVLTNTFTKSNTNMLQLAEAAQYAAPIAAARGMKLEDMMALVGVMSDAGIQSSMAGTTLRMMMNNIYKPSKTQMPTWEKLAKLGVTRTDANGNWLSVIDILDQIAQKVPVNGKAGESLADIMGNLFRVTSAAGATQLAKNITKVKSLRDSNINSYGAAESIRESRINNVRGKWAQVSSQFTENILQIFEKPEMQQKIMGLLDKFRDVLAKPETIKSLESVFDVLLSMANFAGKMAEWGAKLVGSAPNLVKAMLQFQFIATMLGSYVIAPIQQLINTIGMFIPARMLGKKSAANTIVSTVAGATGGAALMGGAATVAPIGLRDSSRLQTNRTLAAKYRGAEAKYNGISSRLRKNQQFAHVAPGAFWGMAGVAPAVTGRYGNAARAMDNRANYKNTAAFWNSAFSNPAQVAREGEYAARAKRFSDMAQRADKLAMESARMAQNYENSIKYGFAYESAFAANMAMSTMAGRQRQAKTGLERFVAQSERRKQHLGNRDLIKRAARIYGPGAVRNGFSNIGNSFTAARAAGASYLGAGAGAAKTMGQTITAGWRGTPGAAMRTAFNAGITAMSINSLFGGFKRGVFGVLTDIALRLSKAFGMLLSPVGIATTMFGSLAWLGYKYVDRLRQGREENEQTKKKVAPLIQRRNNLFDKWNSVNNRVAYSKFNNVQKWSSASKYNPQLQNASEYKELYAKEEANSDYEYGKTRFEAYIQPYSKYLYGKDLSYDEFRKMFNNGGWDGQYRNRVIKQSQRGIIYDIINNSSRFKRAREVSQELIKSWSQLPENERNASYNQLINRLSTIRDSFDYKNGLDISGRDFRSVRHLDIINSKQGKLAAWQMLNQFIGGGTLDSKRLFASYNMSNSTPFSNKWFQSFDTITSEIKLNSLGNATLEFKNGTANWKKFYTDLKKMNIEFANTTGNHLQVLTSIADYISKDPNLKELESLRLYLQGLINYIQNFDAKKVLGDFRREMQIMSAPINVPVTKTLPGGDAPQYIQKPGKTVWSNSYFKDVDDAKKNSVNALKYVDQTPYAPFTNNNKTNGTAGVTAANNTVNIHIDSVMGTDRDSAQLFSEIVGNELVKALGIIGGQNQSSIS